MVVEESIHNEWLELVGYLEENGVEEVSYQLLCRCRDLVKSYYDDRMEDGLKENSREAKIIIFPFTYTEAILKNYNEIQIKKDCLKESEEVDPFEAWDEEYAQHISIPYNLQKAIDSLEFWENNLKHAQEMYIEDELEKEDLECMKAICALTSRLKEGLMGENTEFLCVSFTFDH